jgi:hypothetical protein
MKNINEPSARYLRNAKDDMCFEHLLAQLRQDQLEAAIAGRMAESAFYAAEAQALRDEFAHQNALCA